MYLVADLDYGKPTYATKNFSASKSKKSAAKFSDVTEARLFADEANKRSSKYYFGPYESDTMKHAGWRSNPSKISRRKRSRINKAAWKRRK